MKTKLFQFILPVVLIFVLCSTRAADACIYKAAASDAKGFNSERAKYLIARSRAAGPWRRGDRHHEQAHRDR